MGQCEESDDCVLESGLDCFTPIDCVHVLPVIEDLSARVWSEITMLREEPLKGEEVIGGRETGDHVQC